MWETHCIDQNESDKTSCSENEAPIATGTLCALDWPLSRDEKKAQALRLSQDGRTNIDCSSRTDPYDDGSCPGSPNFGVSFGERANLRGSMWLAEPVSLPTPPIQMAYPYDDGSCCPGSPNFGVSFGERANLGGSMWLAEPVSLPTPPIQMASPLPPPANPSGFPHAPNIGGCDAELHNAFRELRCQLQEAYFTSYSLRKSARRDEHPWHEVQIKIAQDWDLWEGTDQVDELEDTVVGASTSVVIWWDTAQIEIAEDVNLWCGADDLLQEEVLETGSRVVALDEIIDLQCTRRRMEGILDEQWRDFANALEEYEEYAVEVLPVKIPEDLLEGAGAVPRESSPPLMSLSEFLGGTPIPAIFM